MIPNGSEAETSCVNGNFICGVVEGFYGKPWTTEQRKKLFKRMRKMSMNTYIYAPKDDCKHRMYWRDLYSVEEADHLTSLIEAAEENNVSFVYAISPGLDMTYSSSKEVTCLKRKLEQVASFGCKAFAMLFDDIEVDMCAPDQEVFQSFAHAQVSVTNEVYQHLSQPSKFFFCPTEYCASRAVPNVPSSGYLNIIGSKLLPGVDVMWTGPKVVSKRITVKSVLELTEVLHRPPVIWDNIHANDYDQKRLFLGPYDGRSPELIPYLRGVMTNPNCEFEPNYIAMHTLGQWSQSTIDGVNRETLLSRSPVSADIKLETDGDFSSDEDIPVNIQGRYKPKQALTAALNDWLEVFFEDVGVANTKMVEVLPPPMLMPASTPLPVPGSALTGLPTSPIGMNNINELPGLDRIDSFMQPTIIAPVNSLLDPPSSSESDSDSVIESMEPMDCVVTPGSSPNCSDIDSLIPHSEVCVEIRDTCNTASSSDSMQVDSDGMPTTSGLWQESKLPRSASNSHTDGFGFDDLAMLVDMFYLPFEHGYKASSMLTEFHWLKCNAHAITNGKRRGATTEQVDAAAEWQSRALQFQEKLKNVTSMIDRLMAVPNKAVVQDIFPYVWDVKGLMMLIDTFISWLGGNESYKEAFTNGDQEPWIFRGGLLGEFQRMLPLEGAADLFYSPCPKAPGVQSLLQVRPYTAQDEAAVYEICRRTCDDGMDGTEIFPNHLDLIGDRLASSFIILSPQYCFVVEDDQGVCGYVLAALNSKELHNMAELALLTEMRAKYPKPEKVEGLSPAEEMICSFHTNVPFLPNSLISQYPSIIRMDMLADRVAIDESAPRRALASAVAALKVNGSHGLYTEINVGDHNTVEMYKKFALCEATLPEPHEDLHILSRLI